MKLKIKVVKMLNKTNVYNKVMLFSIGSTQEARMLIQDYKGYPRLSVFVKDKSSKERASLKVNFAINKQALYFIVNELKAIVKIKEEYSVSVDMFSPVWEDDKQTDGIKKSGTFTLGKKKVKDEYVIYFTLENNNGLKFSFKILPSPYVKIIRNGTLLQGEELSIAWTLAYATMLNGILDLSLEANDGETSLNDATKSKVINNENISKELSEI